MIFRRREPPQPALTRDEVLDIFGALADILSDTRSIRRILEDHDDAEANDS